MRKAAPWFTLLLWAASGPAPAAPDQRGTGVFRGQMVTFIEHNGQKRFQGDILLDHVGTAPGRGARHLEPGAGVAYSQYLWPKDSEGVAEIPYVVTSGASQLSAALSAFNQTFAGVIQFVPYSNQTDYVNFDFDQSNASGQCESYVGRIGGEQNVGGSYACSLGTLLHEMGHVVGLYHEMTRPDRNSYVTVNYNNVIKGSEDNFAILSDNFQLLGLFDYASVMMYIPFAFTRNGGPVLESIPPGMQLSNLTGYTAGDIDGVERLYGAAPTAVTVTSNPPGLTVSVDGAPVVTPKTYNWQLNSTHTLAVGSSAQTLNTGGAYIYGTWNDNPAASHSIKIKPGNKTLVQPGTSPAVTVYTANFIQLSQYTASIQPQGAGSVAVSPPAQSYPGVSGAYLVARQNVILTPTGTNNYQFVTWGGTSAPFSANPKQDYVPDGAMPYAVTGYFSTEPITTITTTPGGFWFTVDGNYYKAPQQFTADLFSGWGAGSKHVVTGFSPTSPYSVNTRYVFKNWSDGGALSHNITIPSGASMLTATYIAQYAPIVYASPYCAASIKLSPSSTNGFYSAGTAVKIVPASTGGLAFAGWTGDLSGKKTTQTLTVNDEELAIANYNISTTPFSLSSLKPDLFASGSSGGTVTISGAGFTSASAIFVNNTYFGPGYVSAKELKVPLNAGDVAIAGAFPIGVSNYPSGGNCGNYSAMPFFVTGP